jgi:hypothetical protein
LNAAAPGLKSCRADGGPAAAFATLKFEPTGRVSEVVLQPDVEPVASCLRERLSQVEVMPFGGTPVAMSLKIPLSSSAK